MYVFTVSLPQKKKKPIYSTICLYIISNMQILDDVSQRLDRSIINWSSFVLFALSGAVFFQLGRSRAAFRGPNSTRKELTSALLLRSVSVKLAQASYLPFPSVDTQRSALNLLCSRPQVKICTQGVTSLLQCCPALVFASLFHFRHSCHKQGR